MAIFLGMACALKKLTQNSRSGATQSHRGQHHEEMEPRPWNMWDAEESWRGRKDRPDWDVQSQRWLMERSWVWLPAITLTTEGTQPGPPTAPTEARPISGRQSGLAQRAGGLEDLGELAVSAPQLLLSVGRIIWLLEVFKIGKTPVDYFPWLLWGSNTVTYTSVYYNSVRDGRYGPRRWVS